MKKVLPFLALALLASCSHDEPQPKPSPTIVGTWQWDQTQEPSTSDSSVPYTVAFFDDGTAAIEVRDLNSSASGVYGYYTYTCSGNTFAITDFDTRRPFMSGAFARNEGSLTLNSYKYIELPQTDTSDFAARIVGSWTSTSTDGSMSISTIETFRQQGEGERTIFSASTDLATDISSEPFRYAVKRNYLIQEFDDRYEIRTISFGNLGNSLVIDGVRYTLQK